MLSEETRRKFEIIVRNMTADQRAELQDHLASVSDEQKFDLIERIVAKYDARVAGTRRPAADAPVRESDFISERPLENDDEDNTPDHVRPPRKTLKKGVRNTIAGIIIAVLLIGIGILAFDFINKGQTVDGNAQETDAALAQATETTAEPTPSPTPTVTPTPEPTRVPLADDHPDLTGLTVVIDPGHQETTDSEQELYASWLSTTKPRCTRGTTGVVTGTPEYELTLQYSLIIADYLEQCGANVILTRDTNDVNISNQERAGIATSNSADLFLRIHADAAGDSMASGVRVYTPDSGSYTDTSPEYAEQLAGLIADAEGLEVNAVRATSLYTGLNYANTVRSFQISLGFLSNSDDEAVLVNEDNIRAVAEAVSFFCEEFV